MKVYVVWLVCAAAGAAASGVSTATAWPGGVTVNTAVLPAHTKAFRYSTTQYINSVPSPYQFAFPPQLAFHQPQVPSYAPFQPAYYPVAGPSYYPAGGIFYPPGVGSIVPAAPPAAPIYPPAPIAPSQPPSAIPPTAPSQPMGDEDTAVVDSAEYPQEQQSGSSTEAPQQSQPQNPPLSGFPSYPQFPQGIPSFPQIPQGTPSFPQIPQFPQGSSPGFPQFPSNPNFPQGPTSAPPSSFPAGANEDRGLNDEDTISVESA